MSEIKTVALTSIDHNPHRMITKYPYDKTKLKALSRSMQDPDVGCWEGVIVRKHGRRYQAAFGHHRLKAAKQAGLNRIPVIVKDLSDAQMLKYMGRENGEDYRTQFLILLETWESVVNFPRGRGNNDKPIDIARFLGWWDGRQLNHTARACNAAHALIEGGYLERKDLTGLSVESAKEIVERAHNRMEKLEKMAAKTKRSRREVEAAKSHIAKGAKITAREMREKKLAQKDLRSQVDVNTYKSAATSKVKDSPLFETFGKALADSINKMLDQDSSGKRLAEVIKVVNQVTMAEDLATLKQLRFELDMLKDRAVAWEKRLIPDAKKVSSLKALENKHA